MKTNGIIYTIIFTFLAAFLFVLLLSFTNVATRDTIERNQLLATRKAVLTAGGISFATDEEAEEKYKTLVKEIEAQSEEAERLFTIQGEAGETIYAIHFSGQGLWGTITGILAANTEVTEIRGIEIVSHNETPGLGGKIDEPYFKAQLRNEQLDNTGTLSVGPGGPGDEDHSNGQIDGISGASRTSNLFEIIINRTIDTLKTRIRGLE